MQQTITANYEKSITSRCSHSKEIGDKSKKGLYYLLLLFRYLLLLFQIISPFTFSRCIDFTIYLDIYIMSRYVTKAINLEMLERLTIWNGWGTS